MNLKIIARIKTDFPEKFGIPRQSGLVPSLMGKIVFEPGFNTPDAIRGIEEFSHLWLLWGFSEVKKENWSATVKPPRLGGRKKMGVFATRSPFRPNPIALSCVKLVRVDYDEKGAPVLIVSGIDMLDDSPIYDIKPYLPYSDCRVDATGGFASKVKENNLTVIFPDNLASLVSPEDKDTLTEILSEDPRTAFINDENRIWGIYYKNLNVRFKVKDKTLTVLEIEILR